MRKEATSESDDEVTSEEDDDDDASQPVYVFMDGVMLDVLHVRTDHCMTVGELLREVCAAAWELTDGAGSDSLDLSYKDPATARAVPLRDGGSARSDGLMLDGALGAPALMATFKNGKRAADRWHEWYEREMLRQEAANARREAAAAAAEATEDEDEDDEAAAMMERQRQRQRPQQQQQQRGGGAEG